ncbi:MAG: hypothetical protein ACJART_002852 [Maribacter sp.]|jgi:hypothetical protein|tara:strand:+ start:592 stop:840 length:249 start_codon:yes stop_codon:yes gene_type:complete
MLSYLYSKKSGQKIGSIKNTNKKNIKAQIAPIRRGYKRMPPFAFGFRVWAINPGIPILKNVNIIPAVTIRKILECVSLMEYR